MGLRKTGSYGALAEITATKEAQKEKDTAGVMRSASSPRLSSSLDNKDKEKVSPPAATGWCWVQRGEVKRSFARLRNIGKQIYFGFVQDIKLWK